MVVQRNLVKRLKAAGLRRANDALAREQYRILSRQIPTMYAIIMVNSFFAAFSVMNTVDYFVAFALPVLLTPVFVIRVVQWRGRIAAIIDAEMKDVRKAMRATITAAFIVSSLLAGWAITLLFLVPDTHRAMVPLYTILSTITCAYCLISLPRAAYAVLLAGSIPLSIAMFFAHDAILAAMGANILIVVIFVVAMVGTQFRQLNRIVASRSEIIAQRTIANNLAYRDQLTTMPNRRAFLDALKKMHSDRPNRAVAVAMLDLNGFKPINDTYGHAAGDSLLVTLGHRLTNAVGENGLVARLGGDEFAVLFDNPKSEEWLRSIAELMLLEIGKPISFGKNVIRTGAALGIALEQRVPKNPLTIMQHADIALYEAKDSPDTSICVFEDNMETRVRRRTVIEQALADNEQSERIRLHFQPIVDLRTNRLAGFEALARWHHPVLGNIAPSEFVEVAERSGHITALTVRLFRQAVSAARLWPDNLTLSFNLSGHGLGASGLDDILPGIVTELHFDPSRLYVEVTEMALLNDMGTARAVLERLQDLGVRIVLDDFGAGYASIGYLQEIRFDGIKLDGSLIKSITHDESSRNLLIGVLHLCKAIGAPVTAEMVETQDQLTLLRTLSIDRIQGYLLGRPMTFTQTLEAIERDNGGSPLALQNS
jgi:diguanylate cyclase (GGDEF)-like protein